MMNAKEAKKYLADCTRKRLEENLNKKIMEACEKGESFIQMPLNEVEISILKAMGYTLKNIAFENYNISWD